MAKFETELKTYDAKLRDLLPANEGKFIVIHGSEVLGVFDTYDSALTAGYEQLGLQEFFVRQISAIPQVSYFTRDVAACHQ